MQLTSPNIKLLISIAKLDSQYIVSQASIQLSLKYITGHILHASLTQNMNYSFIRQFNFFIFSSSNTTTRNLHCIMTLQGPYCMSGTAIHILETISKKPVVYRFPTQQSTLILCLYRTFTSIIPEHIHALKFIGTQCPLFCQLAVNT